MDPAVILKYRRLLTTDFPNSGELEQPAVFVEAIGGKLINCGNTGNYMQLFVQLNQDSIEDIKYRCSCEPSANVAVEILCELSRHQPLSVIKQLTREETTDLKRAETTTGSPKRKSSSTLMTSQVSDLAQ